MKNCPSCQRVYADDTLSYCLDDGTALLSVAGLDLDRTLALDQNMKCGMGENCQSHERIILEVDADETLTGISIGDWWANLEAFFEAALNLTLKLRKSKRRRSQKCGAAGSDQR